jgi:ribonuclease HII
MNFEIENQFLNEVVAGIDEAGRGPLAGPVVAAAVIVDKLHVINGINDSKKLSRIKREELYEQITKHYHYAVAVIDAQEIDRINILRATIEACTQAGRKLSVRPDVVIVDGNMKFDDDRFISVVKGDTKSISIAAASIVAKVTRDRIMDSLAVEFPEYCWQKNAGYGTKDHIGAIKKFGLTSYHRKSFKLREI